MLVAYCAAVLLSAALLFGVQPMVAKMALPRFGGGPSVWNTCMVFFQALLLVGYAYAHLSRRWLRPTAQLVVHLVVLIVPLLFLPIGLATWIVPVEGRPVLALLGLLAISVGPPVFVLSSTGPLLQSWFASTEHRNARDPYFLYAASNFGSLAVLVSYPFLLEPALGLASQSRVWSAGYVVFVALTLSCGVLAVRRQPSGVTVGAQQLTVQPSTEVTLKRKLRWVLLALVPSSAMLGATQYLTTDIAAVPLLWVIPLALYLLTAVLAFLPRTVVPPVGSSFALAVLTLEVVVTFWIGQRPPLWVLVSLHLLTLFAVGMVCHGQLAQDRPQADRLTEFYLLVALGGFLGGAFNALVAPLVFDSVLEYPIVLLVACLLRPGPRRGALALDVVLPAALAAIIVGLELNARRADVGGVLAAPWLRVGLPSVLCLLFIRRPVRFFLGLAVLLAATQAHQRSAATVLHAERTFFGVNRVVRFDSPRPYNCFIHGTTRHGSQFLDPNMRSVATSYFHATGPIGQLFLTLGDASRIERVAVIGLGAGTLAAYGRAGQHFVFYEIDPAVVRIARDEGYFTYLRDCRASTDFVVGDARLEIAKAPDGWYDLIVVDAFSSDAIPVHLFTREAVALYFRKLSPNGIVAINLTSRYLDLAPVVDAIATDLSLAGLVREDDVTSLDQLQEGKERSTWAVLGREPVELDPLAQDPRWRRLPNPGFLWTDDFSNVLGVMRGL